MQNEEQNSTDDEESSGLKLWNCLCTLSSSSWGKQKQPINEGTDCSAIKKVGQWRAQWAS